MTHYDGFVESDMAAHIDQLKTQVKRLQTTLDVAYGGLRVELIGCRVVRDGDTIRIEAAEAAKKGTE